MGRNRSGGTVRCAGDCADCETLVSPPQGGARGCWTQGLWSAGEPWLGTGLQTPSGCRQGWNPESEQASRRGAGQSEGTQGVPGERQAQVSGQGSISPHRGATSLFQ